MNKKFLALVVATFSLLMASCGGSGDESPTDALQDAAPSPQSEITSQAGQTLPAPSIPPTAASRYPWGDDGRIAFTFTNADDNYEIYVMNSDGSGSTNLTNHEAFDAGPTWSPDGQMIAFYSKRDGNLEIYVMNADGGNPINLTNNPASDSSPAWSPDGEYIAFSSDRDGDSDIYVMGADGSDPTNLTQSSADESGPAWSPDGQRMAFASDRDGSWQIYVMDLISGDVVNVSNLEDKNYSPAWSPDGQMIAFWSERFGIPNSFREIYLVDSDGENLVQLTHHLHGSYYPTWSPDGQWIAYGYAEEGQRELRVIDITSQEWNTLGETWGGGSDPAWLWSTEPPEVAVELPTPRPTDMSTDGAFQPDAAMVRVPAGTYSIGGEPAEALELCQIFRDQCQIEWFYDEAPVHQVTLDEFFIDQYEVTNADYAQCVEAGVCAPPDQTGSATRASYYGNPQYNDYPVIYVSWEDAAIYCDWRGARLPTEAEWEAAARGSLEGNPYPWGIEFPICESGTMWGARFDDGDLCDDADTSPVGSFFSNFLDIYDMAGNVIEWTADWYDVYPGGDPSSSNDYGEIYRVARGGSWYTFADTLRVSIRFPAAPTASFDHYGFRCADSP
jgi:formylglycine-generating enzyme required for sulfatase activity